MGLLGDCCPVCQLGLLQLLLGLRFLNTVNGGSASGRRFEPTVAQATRKVF